MRSSRFATLLLAGLVALSVPLRPAHAEPRGAPREDVAAKAAVHAEAGKKAFAAERYAEAITEFRAAHALQPDAKLVYSIAQAQRLSGDCTAAIVTYEELVKANTDPKLTEFSTANITRCKELLAKEPPKPPPPEPPPPPPPPPQQQPPPQQPPPPPQEPPPVVTTVEGNVWYRDWVGHALVGGGIAVAVGGTSLWVSGRNRARAVNDATDYADFVEKRDAASSALNRQRIGIAMGGVGVGLIIGGVIKYTMGSKREVQVSANASTSGGQVTARFTF